MLYGTSQQSLFSSLRSEPPTSPQGSTFPGAQGHMPHRFCCGPRDFSGMGPKVICIITRNPVFDHLFLAPSLKTKCQTLPRQTQCFLTFTFGTRTDSDCISSLFSSAWVLHAIGLPSFQSVLGAPSLKRPNGVIKEKKEHKAAKLWLGRDCCKDWHCMWGAAKRKIASINSNKSFAKLLLVTE